MDRIPTVDRRSFLKKSAVLGIAGITGVTAASRNASAASNEIRVSSPSSYRERYVMTNTSGDFYFAGNNEGPDWAGDRAVGTLAGGADKYMYNGKMSYMNVADGNDSSDKKIHINFDWSGVPHMKFTADPVSQWRCTVAGEVMDWDFHVYGNSLATHEIDSVYWIMVESLETGSAVVFNPQPSWSSH